MKGIFFDFDGVITYERMGSPKVLAYISDKLGVSYEKLYNVYMPRNKEMLRGELLHEDIWNDLCEAVGQSMDYQILEDAFLNVSIDPVMVEYIRELKKKYLIGMITDNKVDRIATIMKYTELGELFDVVIISADVKSQKIDKKIFETALEKSGLSPEESVFIDNVAENLIAPKEMGFHTIFFADEENRDVEAFKKTLHKLLDDESVISE